MKNWMKNIICSREWTGEVSKMDRVWSRMTSIKPAYNQVMILTFLFLVLGGFTMSAWGADRDIYARTAVVNGVGGTARVETKWKASAVSYGTVGTPQSTKGTDLVTTGNTEKHSGGLFDGWPDYWVVYAATADDGYSFDAWYTDSKGTVGKVEGTTYETDKCKGPIEYLTYYAKFTPNNYTIVYNNNGGSGSMESTSAEYASSVTLRKNTFTNSNNSSYTVTYDPDGGSCAMASVVAGYSFHVWNTASDGTGEEDYTDEESVLNLATSGSVTLYAQWIPTVILPNATKAGKVLEGWYYEELGKDPVKVGRPGDAYYPTGSVILKAYWTNKLDPSIIGSNTALKVGEEQTTAFTLYQVDGPVPNIEVVSIDSINSGNGKVIEYDAANNKIIAHNAGTATIYFYQAETNTVKEYTSSTYTYTVTKNSNTLKCAWDGGEAGTIWRDTTGFDTKYSVKFSSTNSSGPTIDVTPSPASEVATYKKGAGGANPDTLLTNHRVGNVSWTIIQQEDYKYVADTAICTLRVEAETIPNSQKYVLNVSSGSDTQMDDAHWTFNEPGDVLTYKIRRSTSATFGDVTVYGYDDNENHNKVTLNSHTSTDLPTSFGDPETVAIPNRSMRKVDFNTGSYVNTKYVSDVKITRKTWMEAQDAENEIISRLEMPQNVAGTHVTCDSFYLDFSTIDDEIKLVSSHDRIKFANGETTYTINTSSVHTSREKIMLYYTSPASGTETPDETITIYNKYVNTFLRVTAETVAKYTPTITWPGGKVFKVGDEIANGFVALDGKSDTIKSGTWSFVSSDSAVVDIVDNKLIAQTLSADSKTVTITGMLTADEFDVFVSGSQTVELTVNRKTNTITIGGGFSETMLLDATMLGITVSSSNSDTEKKPFSIIRRPSADTAVFTMTGAGAGSIESKHYLGTVTWRVHQDADGTYKAADKEFSVTISKDTEDTSRKIYIYESPTGTEYDRGDFPETWWDIKNVAKKLYVQVKSGAKDSWVKAQEYDEAKSNWVDLSKITGESEINIDSFDADKTAERSLTRTSTGIRFNDSGGKGTKIVRNVKVECYSYLRVNVSSDETADTLKITKQADGVHPIYMDGEGLDTLRVYYGISYNSGDLKLVCDNPKFTFTDERSAGMTLLENSAFPKAGKQEVKVYYNPTEAVNDTAHVIIYNKAFYKEVILVGVNIKYSQTVTWNIGAQLKLDDKNKISNAANVTLGTAITYRSSDGDVVEVTDEGTKLLAKSAGTARIYASALGNGRYYDALDSIDVTVVALKSTATVDEKSDWSSVDEVTPVSVTASVDIETEVSVYSLNVAASTTVTVKPTGGLEIGAGGVTIAAGGKLVIETTPSGETKGETGYIRFSPYYTGDMPEAEIQLHKRGYNKSGTSKWQYIGYPMEAGAEAKTVFYRNYLRSWVEETSSWVNNISSLNLASFAGYAVSQARNLAGETHVFTGTLRENRGDTVINLTHAGEGWNLLANSYAAPIDVTRLTKEDFGGAEATIYIWDTDGREYIEIPVLSAEDMLAGGSLESVVVPAMQGFFVKTSKATTLTLDYNRLVWGADPDHGNSPVRVKRRAPENRLDGHMRIRLIEGENEDEVILMESAERFSSAYENGVDAYKKMGETGIGIYAIENGESIAVDATDELIGTELGIKTGESDWYTISFNNVQGEKKLCLRDSWTGKETAIENGATYSFYAEPNSVVDGRFAIIASKETTNTATGVDNEEVEKKAMKYIKDESVYILKNGVKYNSLGQRVQ